MTTDRALCATLLPTVGDLWFSTDPADRARAKAYCRTCPLQPGCAQAGLDLPGARGVWGGMSAGDRRVYRTGKPGPDPDNDGDDGPLKPRRPCGDETAFRAHRQHGETCTLCEAAHDARVEAQRRARLDVEHAAGGSSAGYQLHRILGEQPCRACTTATTLDRAQRKDRARSRPPLRSVPAGQEAAAVPAATADPVGAAA